MFSLECDLLRRNRYDLKEKALAYESRRSYYEVVLADMGVTRTPSEVVDTDLVYYLVREFTAMGVKDFYSELDGIPHILEVDYLKYKRSFMVGKSDFKDVLDIIIKYLECLKTLQGIYEYECGIHVIPRLPNVLTKVKLVYRENPDDDGWYSSKYLQGIDSFYNSLYGEVEKVARVSDYYYKHFIRVTGYEPLKATWSFFEGRTRLQELSYIKYVVNGKIRPTGVPKEYYDKYLDYLIAGGKPYADLLPYLQEDLQIKINKIKALGGYVKAITPYGVYYYDKDKEYKYKTYLTFYCYDYDNEEMLPLRNQVRGIGGEFSSDIKNSIDGVPYKISGYTGNRKLYRVAGRTKVRYYDLDFRLTTGLLRNMYARRGIRDMVEVTNDIKPMIRKELKEIFR